jgi:hypothetical protein
MKRLLLLAALAASASGVFAQGTISFISPSGMFVTWDGIGTPAAAGTRISAAYGVRVGLYYNNTLVSSLAQVGTSSTGTTNAAFDGRFGTTVTATIPGLAPGATGTSFQVKAWSGNFATYDDAKAGGALYTGESAQFSNVAGGGVDPVTGGDNLPAALSGFTGMTVTGIPEPSTIALAALGLGGLLALRRRK